MTHGLYPAVRSLSADPRYNPWTRAISAAGAILGAAFVLAFARNLLFGLGLGATLVPDTSLYAQGGFGLFPSPLGRAFGYFGATVLAVWSAIGAGVSLCLVVVLALRSGSSGTAAFVWAFLLPMGWWMLFTGVDALGAALMLGGFLAVRLRGLWFGLAVLTHSALIPLLLTVARKFWLLIIPGVIAMALWTPYSTALDPLSLAGGLTNGIIIVAFVCLPFLILDRMARWVAPPGLAIAALATLCGVGAMRQGLPSPELWTATRYGLPLFLLCCAGVRR